jgi:hypothetical protein
MTNQVIADFITPSDEITAPDGSITTENLLDEVNLYNLYDDVESPEQDAERILDITYPTRTLEEIIEKSVAKLDSDSDITDGAHVIGGEYGTGKSHIQLVVYHLLTSPQVGDAWLNEHDLSIDIPRETRTAALQMLNLEDSYNRLWEAVGAYVGIDDWVGQDDTPSVHDIRDAMRDRPTALMIDEFERWFGMSARSDYTDDNLAFLQNLLEAAGRADTPLVVHVSLLYQNDNVEGIVPRTNPFLHDLSEQREEKIQFILHRLVGEVTDSDGVAAVAKEYTDVYRNNDQIHFNDYQQLESRIEARYPFHPGVLRLLMEKFAEQESHQDARGLLDFLTQILSENYTTTDLILTGNVDVFGHLNRFQYIDSELVSKYSNDYYRLQNEDEEFEEYIEELLNIVLLHSLSRDGDEGANKRQLLMGLLRKGGNAHRIINTFTDDVYGHAWHIHRINGEFAFDVDENPSARIQKKAEDIHKDEATHRVESLIKEELFDNHNNVHILNPVNTEQDIPDNKTLKIVVSLHARENQRGYNDDFEALTTGQEREFNNTLVLVTPEKRSSVDTDTGIRGLARKVVAGERLRREEEVLPDGFDDIDQQNYKNLRDRVRDKYGTVHTSTERGLYPEDLELDDDEDLYTATLDVVRPDPSLLKREVKTAVEDAGAGGIQYQHLKNDFYRNPTYPTLTSESGLDDAVNALCQDGEIKVGTYFEERVGSLGEDTTLVHETFVTPDKDEEPTTITVDTTETDDSSADAGDGGEESSGGEGGSAAVEAFRCPECDSVLEGTSCECGFEFGATEVEEGEVTVEGATTEDLVDQFEELQEEVEEQREAQSTQPFPTLGSLEADSQAELIDTLERKLGLEWEIHQVELTVHGTLTEDDLSDRGITADDLAEHVELEETFTISPDDPLSKQGLLNVLWDLSVPERASISIRAEVTKNE